MAKEIILDVPKDEELEDEELDEIDLEPDVEDIPEDTSTAEDID